MGHGELEFAAGRAGLDNDYELGVVEYAAALTLCTGVEREQQVCARGNALDLRQHDTALVAREAELDVVALYIGLSLRLALRFVGMVCGDDFIASREQSVVCRNVVDFVGAELLGCGIRVVRADCIAGGSLA